MRYVSLQAWSKTTKLLSKEVKRHLIKSKLIDSFKIYKKALDVDQKQASQSKLSMVINLVHKKESLSSGISLRYSKNLAPNQPKKTITFFFGTLRQKSKQKYLFINSISMQFYCIKQMLLELISDTEQSLLSYYFKVIQHFYLSLSCF